MMDATLRALMAVDEIPRVNLNWRDYSNRPAPDRATTQSPRRPILHLSLG